MVKFLRVVLIFAVALTVSLNVSTKFAYAASPLSVSDNQGAGTVILENDVYKAVWKYKTNAGENNNQSGGNIYGLYFKATDPGLTNNLVGMENYGGGNAVIWPGVGGSGSTRIYATDTPPAASGTLSFTDLIGDNNLSGILLDHSVEQLNDGSIHLSFTFNVKNQYTNAVWYRVTKDWVAYPDGSVDLTTLRQFLRSGYISEPGTCFEWDKERGWARFEKYGHDWGQNQSSDHLVSIHGIDQVEQEPWDSLNMFYPKWVRLSGSSTAPDITVEAVGGFENSGLFGLGQTLWNGTAGSTMEQSVYGNSQVTAYAMAWLGWWGGNPPVGTRYRYVTAQTSFTDHYRIALGTIPPEMQSLPRISNLQLRNVNAGTATIDWSTDIPVGSKVNYAAVGSGQGTNVTVPSPTTQHSVTITGLSSTTTYKYTVGDGISVAVTGAGEFNTSQAAPFEITLTLGNVRWASYSDYQARMLTVQYNLSNHGPSEAHDVSITTENTSDGVVCLNLPLQLGTLGQNQSLTFDASYYIPSGVTTFRSKLAGSAADSNGTRFSLYAS